MSERSRDVAAKARLLARATLKGAFATTRRAARPSAKGQPYVSKVTVAWDESGQPVFLFSTLAAHTQDILADNRVSLLVEAPATALNPQEDARATLVGRVRQLSANEADDAVAHAKDVFLAHHPRAAMYAGFGDFSFWTMQVDKVHYVGGFGASKWGRGADFAFTCLGLKEARGKVLDSLNSQKKDELQVLILHTCGLAKRAAQAYQAVHVDSDGVVAANGKGGWVRIDFNSPAKDLSAWRARWRAALKRAQNG